MSIPYRASLIESAVKFLTSPSEYQSTQSAYKSFIASCREVHPMMASEHFHSAQGLIEEAEKYAEQHRLSNMKESKILEKLSLSYPEVNQATLKSAYHFALFTTR